MKSASAGLIAALNGGQKFLLADLYTFTLANGTILRYAMGDTLTGSLVYGGNTYIADTIMIERGQIETNIGVQFTTMELTVIALPAHLINGTPWLQALRQGALDSATVSLDTLYMTTPGDTSLGVLHKFGPGRVADISEIGRTMAHINVHDARELLNTQLPRQYYQPSCANVLFDSACGLNRASFAVTSTVASGSTKTLINCALAQVAGWFTLGTITFTSGANNGASVTVKQYTPGAFQLMAPLLATPGVGDTFTAYPGCPKTKSACENSDTTVGPAFDNVVNFRGFPFVPSPETVL